MSPVVAFCALGTNRSMSVLRSNNDEVPETVPTLDQVEPPLVEYSQLPLPLVVAVIAMPSTAPESTSVMRSPPALLMIEATV